MANGIRKLLERHLETVDLNTNASVENMLVAAIIEVLDDIKTIKSNRWKTILFLIGVITVPIVVTLIQVFGSRQ